MSPGISLCFPPPLMDSFVFFSCAPLVQSLLNHLGASCRVDFDAYHFHFSSMFCFYELQSPKSTMTSSSFSSLFVFLLKQVLLLIFLFLFSIFHFLSFPQSSFFYRAATCLEFLNLRLSSDRIGTFLKAAYSISVSVGFWLLVNLSLVICSQQFSHVSTSSTLYSLNRPPSCQGASL